MYFDLLQGLITQSGIYNLTYKEIIMFVIAAVLVYLAIEKKYEPLLLLPIAIGMILTNLPMADLMKEGGLLYYIYKGIDFGLYPPLIFLGIGAMTDFGPLIANPKSILLGAGAQAGIFFTLISARLLNFSLPEAASTSIIGGADGPTAIFLTSRLSPELLGAVAIAAYSYMALVPIIQPPLMKWLTTKKERQIKMYQLREVSRLEKLLFAFTVMILGILFIPSAGALLGSLMLGNILKESGVTERLADTARNSLTNIVTIFLGISVGAKTQAALFLTWKTLMIIGLGLIAFAIGTIAGLLLAKLMNKFSKTKINPLIGSAGVSAVPMAARVSQKVGAEENPNNHLLMHAMGPNVAGVIGSATAAGVLLTLIG